jgi:hypothetical protein
MEGWRKTKADLTEVRMRLRFVSREPLAMVVFEQLIKQVH